MGVRHFRRWIAFAAIVVAAVVLSRIACRTRPIEVDTGIAGIGPVEDVATNSEAGTVRSRAQSKLGVERAGRVASIAREGTEVRRGATLVQLDASTARTQLEAAERDHEALRAAHEVTHAAERLARQQWNRVEELRSKHLVSDADVDQARSALERAEAELGAAEARLAGARSSVRLARDEVDHLRVRAPFDGVVARRLAEVGEAVVPGQPVLELVSRDRLYVSAPIDERDAGRLAEGLEARITVDTYPGVTWTGELARVAPIVEEVKAQNRTLEVEVDLPPDDSRPRPRPGMTADVEIVLDRRPSALRVPSAAVIEGRRVMVIEGGRAKLRDVTIGLRNWKWSEVRTGLSDGECVITSLDRAGLGEGVAVEASASPGEGGSSGTSATATSR